MNLLGQGNEYTTPLNCWAKPPVPVNQKACSKNPGSCRTHLTILGAKPAALHNCWSEPMTLHNKGPSTMTLGSVGVQPAALPYSPTELLNVACGLAQTGSPASDPIQPWNITCGPTQPGSLSSDPALLPSTIFIPIWLWNTEGGHAQSECLTSNLA